MKYHKRNRWIFDVQPIARAVVVIAAVVVLATGVTFAALQSQAASLTGNSISTATADLRIGTSASTFSNTRVGFSFGNVVPGAAPTPADGNTFYLKNYGAAPMSLKVAVSTTPVNSSNVDLSKVYLILSRVDTSAVQKLKLDALVSSYTAGGMALTDQLAGGTTAQYKIQVTMDDDAFTGQSATIGGIDLVFNGTVTAVQ